MIGTNSMSRNWVRLTGAVASVTLLAACSSSSPKPTNTATSSSVAASPSLSIGPADAATTAAVSKSYETFFDYKTPTATVATLLQDGAEFTTEIASNAKLAAQQKVTVKVATVTVVTASTAKVSFDLFLNGSPALQKTSGYAVLENGTWKVSGATFCALLGMNNAHPAVCTKPAATTLP